MIRAYDEIVESIAGGNHTGYRCAFRAVGGNEEPCRQVDLEGEDNWLDGGGILRTRPLAEYRAPHAACEGTGGDRSVDNDQLPPHPTFPRLRGVVGWVRGNPFTPP